LREGEKRFAAGCDSTELVEVRSHTRYLEKQIENGILIINSGGVASSHEYGIVNVKTRMN
jgi:hypothetical protein